MGSENVRDEAIETASSNHVAVPVVFKQDTVRHRKTGAIGLVNEVYLGADAEMNLKEDESDDDNLEKEKKSEKSHRDHNVTVDGRNDANRSECHVLVHWLDNTEPRQHVNDLIVTDRAFLIGDYVTRASNPGGQVGMVQDVDVHVDLLLQDGSMMKNVSTRDLTRVKDIYVDDDVVLGPWLGKVDDVSDTVTVLADDGFLCKVKGAEPQRLKPISNNDINGYDEFPYYPGLRVKANSLSVFRGSACLPGLWKSSRSLEGTVVEVMAGSVFISWIASDNLVHKTLPLPGEKQSPSNLKLLDCFSYARWQMYDRCLLLPSSMDASSASSSASRTGPGEPEENGRSTFVAPTKYLKKHDGVVMGDRTTLVPVIVGGSFQNKKLRKIMIKKGKKACKKKENFARTCSIVNMNTKVYVLWQDGTVEDKLDSTLLVPVSNLSDHEFLPGEFVMEKEPADVDFVDGLVKCIGVVKNVDADARTACVRWFKPVSQWEEPCEFDREETVSVYGLVVYPDYGFSHGDIVGRLRPEPFSAQIAPNSQHNGQHSEKSQDGSASSLISWVGNVSGLRNGEIEVTWIDGKVSMVGPEAIFVIHSEESVFGSESEFTDAASWETNVNDMVDDENAHEEVANQSESMAVGKVAEDNSRRNSGFSLPSVALDVVTKFANGIFSRSPRTVQSNMPDSTAKHEPRSSGAMRTPEGRDSACENGFQSGDNGAEEAALGSPDAAESLCNLTKEKSDAHASSEHHGSKFKHFDIVNSPSDHHFVSPNSKINNKRNWLKKVQQDWNIMQENLPDGIYARVYEDRIDLLRAAIVGACGTPYQDGLFFFDFQLPPEYPSVPPFVHFRSGGWRINPNLYEAGTVCLSLLNTWNGKGNEIWDPMASSILQVLVSLQGLVLNSRPYFNEAGYDSQNGTAEGEKNSLSYNENVFLLNCKLIMFLIRRPPMGFEELVEDHFRRRGCYLLKACDAYMKGDLIGSLDEHASSSRTRNSDLTSVGFKLMLAKIQPKLASALEKIGTPCSELNNLTDSEKQVF